jgi:hypothetical protein
MNTTPPLTRKVDLLERLLMVFSVEQLEVWTDALLRTQERAVERRCDQSVTITMNDKGYPRHCKASDDVAFTKPREGER